MLDELFLVQLLKENLKTFLEKFPKFDIKYSAFFRKKKKLIKPKRNKNK
jgi:hypothetical protein